MSCHLSQLALLRCKKRLVLLSKIRGQEMICSSSPGH
jgi:hypothetical protein